MALVAVDALAEKPLDGEILDLIRRDVLEPWSAEEILTWAVKKFHPRLTLSSSFGAPEGMVLIDMLHAIDPTSRIFVPIVTT